MEEEAETTINIISNLAPFHTIDNLYNFNTVVAWFLNKAFKKLGVESRLVQDHALYQEAPPVADHSLLVSSYAFVNFTPERWPGDKAHQDLARRYSGRIRKQTKGKVVLYLDSNLWGYDKYFDLIFTIVKPLFTPESERWFTHKEKYIYAGWGADPNFFYPDKGEKALYFDHNKQRLWLKKYYEIYDKVISEMDITVFKTVDNKRIPWNKIREYFRKSHYYCDTLYGESSLTRIEAATSGALLVIPKPCFFPRTVGSLEYIIWDTEEELIKALNIDTNPQKIREKALKHSWIKTAERIIQGLQG